MLHENCRTMVEELRQLECLPQGVNDVQSCVKAGHLHRTNHGLSWEKMQRLCKQPQIHRRRWQPIWHSHMAQAAGHQGGANNQRQAGSGAMYCQKDHDRHYRRAPAWVSSHLACFMLAHQGHETSVWSVVCQQREGHSYIHNRFLRKLHLWRYACHPVCTFWCLQ